MPGNSRSQSAFFRVPKLHMHPNDSTPCGWYPKT